MSREVLVASTCPLPFGVQRGRLRLQEMNLIMHQLSPEEFGIRVEPLLAAYPDAGACVWLRLAP